MPDAVDAPANPLTGRQRAGEGVRPEAVPAPGGPPRRPGIGRRLLSLHPLVLLALAGLVTVLVLRAPAWSAAFGEIELAASSGVEGIVTVEDGELTVDGEGWSPLGFNDYRLTSHDGGYVCDPASGTLDDGELGARLDRIRAAGGNAVRTWFFQSFWDHDHNGAGSWQQFDRVIDAAAERELRVIPVLANHWQDCTNGGPEKDFDYYSQGFRAPYGDEAFSFLEYAAMVAERYRGEAAIAYWELVNEPEAPDDGICDEEAASEALASFAAAGAAAVRAADPSHLVGLGTIGSGQCGTAGSSFERVAEPLDLCHVHLYDGPDTGSSPTEPLPRGAEAGLLARTRACVDKGKPMVVGEMGFQADLDAAGESTGTVSEETLAARAGFFRDRAKALEDAGIDGALVWQIADEMPAAGEGDPFTIAPCDPLEGVMRELGEVDPDAAPDPECG
jgi:mannan endo-1,4-beta-mannosidase